MFELAAPWWWLAAAAALAVAEIVAPGIFMIWLAAAAACTGFVIWLIPGVEPGIAVQLVIFAVLSFISVYIGRTIMLRNPTTSADPLLNNRAGRLIGETGVVVQAIASGSGRVQIGDSPWPATGPDIGAGQTVRVVAVDGNRLKVELFQDGERSG